MSSLIPDPSTSLLVPPVILAPMYFQRPHEGKRWNEIVTATELTLVNISPDLPQERKGVSDLTPMKGKEGGPLATRGWYRPVFPVELVIDFSAPLHNRLYLEEFLPHCP